MAVIVTAGGTVGYLDPRWSTQLLASHPPAGAADLVVADLVAAVHPDDAAKAQAALVRGAAGEAFDEELRLRAAGGGYRWFVLRGRPLEPGRADGDWLATFVDVDDRVTAERQQREATAPLDAVVDRAPFSLAVIDPDSRYVLVNRVALTTLGAGPVLGRTIEEVVPDAWPDLEPLVARARAGKTVEGVVLAVARPDGTVSHQLTTVFPLGPGTPEAFRVAIAAVDVSTRGIDSRRRSARRRSWRCWASCPAASPTTSTTCSA